MLQSYFMGTSLGVHVVVLFSARLHSMSHTRYKTQTTSVSMRFTTSYLLKRYVSSKLDTWIYIRYHQLFERIGWHVELERWLELFFFNGRSAISSR